MELVALELVFEFVVLVVLVVVRLCVCLFVFVYLSLGALDDDNCIIDGGDGDAVADDEEDDHLDDVFCTVCERITCMAAPPAVHVCITSNCLRCVCWVPLGCEIFWESDIWN